MKKFEVEGLREELVAGNEAKVEGVGKFTSTLTMPRKGRNPKTGEEISIPAKRKVKFTVDKKLNEAINEAELTAEENAVIEAKIAKKG